MDDVSKPLAILCSWGEERSKIWFPIMVSAEVTIGRSENNTICLSSDRMISRNHCVIRVVNKRMILKDLGSRNGTYLNGEKVLDESPLKVPSWFQLGNTRFIVTPFRSEDGENTLMRRTIFPGEENILIPPTDAMREQKEALLVVDLVNSTAILKADETRFIEIVTAMGEVLEGVLCKGQNPYLQATGDGFLACFDMADAALKTATELGPRLRRLFGTPLQTCVALHWGKTRVTAKGNRTGNDVYAVFSLQNLRHNEKKLTQYLLSDDFCDLVVLTEAFLHKITPESRNRSRSLGTYPLKGFNMKTEIFQCVI